jgi:hypothetical protein
MAFDHKAFAKEVGMADDDISALDALFGKYPSAAMKIDSVLTSQVEARLKPLQDQITTKQAELDEQFTALSSIRAGDGDAIAKAEERIEKLSAQMATLTERTRKVGREAGIDVEPLLADLTTPAVRVETRPDLTSFNRDEVFGHANKMAFSALENSALLEDLAAEHARLFPGQTFSRVELLADLKTSVQRTQNTNLTLKDVFDKKFNVEARREEMREAAVVAREKAAEDRGRKAAVDEMALRGPDQQPTTFQRSPVFAKLGEGADHVQVQGVPEAVQAAVLDFRQRVAARQQKTA